MDGGNDIDNRSRSSSSSSRNGDNNVFADYEGRYDGEGGGEEDSGGGDDEDEEEDEEEEEEKGRRACHRPLSISIDRAKGQGDKSAKCRGG